MTMLPRVFNRYQGYCIKDVKEYLSGGSNGDPRIEVKLERSQDKEFRCRRCGYKLSVIRGRHSLRLETLPVFGVRCFVSFWRLKGHCSRCKKARSESVDFIAEETPHLSAEYSFWIGRLCEISAVSRVAELVGLDGMSTWRIDFKRMRRLAQNYKIPKVKRISVDEVYARKKPRYKGESRDKKFFTVISDLDTKRVIWVSESREKKALDQFFILLGKKACSKIKVVATDQHEGYRASIKEHCPEATHVWDRFHIMQGFEEAANEVRKDLHGELAQGSEIKRLTRGKFRFVFLKKASKRDPQESKHINEVLEENKYFAKLELVKERMLTLFNEPTESKAWQSFQEIGDWIFQAGFKPLMKWFRNLESQWDTLKNYFSHRVTTSLSEGFNNVIKTIKKRAYGYRNMEYFRLKIMQVCGYLNSKYVPLENQ